MFESVSEAVASYRAAAAEQRTATAAATAARAQARNIGDELHAIGHEALVRALSLESANAPAAQAPYTAQIERLTQMRARNRA